MLDIQDTAFESWDIATGIGNTGSVTLDVGLASVHD
jgi:hypothetical protein